MRERRLASETCPVAEFDSLASFFMEGHLPHGRFVVPYEGIPVDFLYEPVPNADTTVIFFHGATKRDVSLPMYSGKSLMEGIRANRLAISDPTLALDDTYEHILSWYAGSSRQPKLQRFLYLVIREILQLSKVQHHIFIGSSGGGFAALEMSRHFAESLVVAMNPQTSLARYQPSAVRRYLRLSWDESDSLDDLPDFVTHDLTSAYPEVLEHTIAYVQNTRDRRHVNNHQIPFLKKTGGDPKLFIMMDAWGDPKGNEHVIPPRDVVKDILKQLVSANGSWQKTLEELGFNQNIPRTKADI